MLATRLVDAVGEAARHDVEVALRQAEHEQRGVRGVVHGVGDRDLGGQSRARLRRRHRVGRDRDHALQSRHGIEALRLLAVGADHEAAGDRRGHVVRVALDLRGEVEQRYV